MVYSSEIWNPALQFGLSHGFFWLKYFTTKSLQFLNSFVPSALFLYPQKTSENPTVRFWCFQGLEKGCIGKKWINRVLHTLLWSIKKWCGKILDFDIFVMLSLRVNDVAYQKSYRQHSLFATNDNTLTIRFLSRQV